MLPLTFLQRLMEGYSCTVTNPNWDSEKLLVFDNLYSLYYNKTLALLWNTLYKSVSY